MIAAIDRVAALVLAATVVAAGGVRVVGKILNLLAQMLRRPIQIIPAGQALVLGGGRLNLIGHTQICRIHNRLWVVHINLDTVGVVSFAFARVVSGLVVVVIVVV